ASNCQQSAHPTKAEGEQGANVEKPGGGRKDLLHRKFGLVVAVTCHILGVFLEAGLLNCINCNPVLRGTRSRPDKASEQLASLQTDSGLQLESGDRVKAMSQRRCSPTDFQSGRRCVETSGDVIDQVCTSFRKNCRALSSISRCRLLPY